MKAIDLQTQMTTEKGALFPKAAKEFFERVFKASIPYYQTEEEMLEVYRKADIKAILIPPTGTRSDFKKIREANDYVADLRDKNADVILGAWVMLNPRISPEKWLDELERCIRDLGFFGFFHYGASTGIPANDESLRPFYKICLKYKVPVKISVGHTAAGAGLPGGGGMRLKYERPIPYIDDVAADFPGLTIIAAHFPWPFHYEMASVLLHKGNVYNEVHGWSPKYFPADFKREINSRLKNKILFGSDWPFFTYERLFKDWEAEGYKEEVLENIYYKNAERIFKLK
jgi:hypothetical protein